MLWKIGDTGPKGTPGISCKCFVFLSIWNMRIVVNYEIIAWIGLYNNGPQGEPGEKGDKGERCKRIKITFFLWMDLKFLWKL